MIRGLMVWLVVIRTATACPFCGPVGRSLAERRDAADAVFIGSAAGAAARGPDGLLVQPLAALAPLRGTMDLPSGALACRVAEPIAGTAILFGSRERAAMSWEAIAADESLIAHVAAAPAVEEPAERRLRWFAARLEHADPAIATDAFTEFGRAPFEAVREAADAFDPGQLAAWLGDERIDQRRRGFYGLALGLAVGTAPATVRGPARAALQAAVEAPGDDLRAGYDGILAGVLVADAEAGLDALSARGLLHRDHAARRCQARPGRPAVRLGVPRRLDPARPHRGGDSRPARQPGRGSRRGGRSGKGSTLERRGPGRGPLAVAWP